ncbi:DUF1963 domain-containing protein [Cellulomonas xiejunii]|uniref:YwqG family protein n=1 Tax=Cellulomonas xiejunii TaxID=2968083 RepID=A0ABY5KNV1_9CELL|nr:YwqG family protein [Cellulomonas xiejunii]MCC2321587.1 DUF1963 domain-containing protein [Cellulomonas xiejunii]MCC2323261.1 DUF1963 domain-containing protein [Cellulomonas xiejunii]UUI72154.1 YwqG family protein [Cellulomonas xiejunii]
MSTPAGSGARFPHDETYGPRAAATMLARHLPADAVDQWLAWALPALRLVPAAPHDEVVARLGGDPDLPDGVPWPVWEGHGPLGYVGELDCAALAGAGVAVPASGRLLFFFFDGSYDDFEGVVSIFDPGSAAGSRVLHVPQGVAAQRRSPPDERVPRLREVRCTARRVLTFPCRELPVVEEALERLAGLSQDDRSAVDALTDALLDWPAEPRHQVGGHAHAAQGPVEHDVAEGALRAAGAADPDREAIVSEVTRWSLLLQLDTDDALGAMWDDCGTLAWFTRDGDPTVHGFAWQSA